jgi:hypothetical protein
MTMDYRLLNPENNNQSVDLNLDLMDIKILHNICVDELELYPQMIGIRNVMEKLKLIIDNVEKNS